MTIYADQCANGDVDIIFSPKCVADIQAITKKKKKEEEAEAEAEQNLYAF